MLRTGLQLLHHSVVISFFLETVTKSNIHEKGGSNIRYNKKPKKHKKMKAQEYCTIKTQDTKEMPKSRRPNKPLIGQDIGHTIS